MFDIEYKGANAVVFTTKNTKVVFDPRVSLAGGTDVSVKDDVEVTTEDRFAVEKTTPKLWFSGPGEYEVGDVSLIGMPSTDMPTWSEFMPRMVKRKPDRPVLSSLEMFKPGVYLSLSMALPVAACLSSASLVTVERPLMLSSGTM